MERDRAKRKTLKVKMPVLRSRPKLFVRSRQYTKKMSDFTGPGSGSQIVYIQEISIVVEKDLGTIVLLITKRLSFVFLTHTFYNKMEPKFSLLQTVHKCKLISQIVDCRFSLYQYVFCKMEQEFFLSLFFSQIRLCTTEKCIFHMPDSNMFKDCCIL